MKLSPSLIPRFNEDYDINDFVYSIRSTFGGDDIELTPLRNIFGNKNFFFTNTGRAALYVLLKALNLPKKSKIGVPLYSCTVVFDSIIKAGGVPYFIDMDLNEYTLDPEDLAKKINALNAVVVIHTFGRPADMDRIKEVAGDVPVIEDCAHSLLSEYKGKQTGTLGVASFFSLAKYLSNGGGGMTILNNDELIEGFERQFDRLMPYSLTNEIRNVFTTYIYSFFYRKPWFGLFAPTGFYLRNLVDRGGGIKYFTVKKIKKSNFNLLFRKLNQFKENVELQRENSFFLLKELKDTSLILPYENKDAYCNYYLFPIRFSNRKERDKAHEYLRDMGVDTAKLYGETPMKAKRFYGYDGDCSDSEIAANTLLIIPNYYTLAKNDLIKIVASIKKVEELL
jgi:dTDP-4-amino-4,6-dideoxygalactose transaminase